LKVPANPYAKQNLFRDCTKPIAKTNNGMNSEKRALRAASVLISPTKDVTEIAAPARATTWRRRISPLPILQLPGMYSWLN
jgi:hypothetical protein